VSDALEFSDRLRLIDERSAAFRAAVVSASSLDVTVPTCPDWTLGDLVQHMGGSRRRWAAIVAAGPATDAPDISATQGAAVATDDREALVAWFAASTQQLLDALQEAGPDRDCWTWWDTSQSPQTCAAVARHQLHEISVHTYDAQLTVGAQQPVPDEVAIDGVEEFLVTCCATTSPWPHEPAVVDYFVTEGRSWRVWLSGAGARVARRPESGAEPVPGAGDRSEPAAASASGPASELVLALYGRLPMDRLELAGDGRLFDQLFAWDPSE
jgi:uncharacterized protein (TIGR03083 family)